jgi:capsular exopolysaccharide synthesis family protein
MNKLTRYEQQPAPVVYTQPVRIVSESDADETLDLRRLVHILLRRRWQILLVAALVVAPAAVWTFMAQPMYASATLVSVDPDPVEVLPYREVDRPKITSNYELFMKSQDQMLRSPTLFNRIAERLRTEPDAEQLLPEIPRLWQGLSMQRIENTSLFRLGYLAPSPEVAARVANLYAEEYIRRHFETRQETREKARQLLERELEALEQRVQLSEKQLVSYAQQNNLPATPDGPGTAQQKLSTLAGQSTDAEAQVFAAQARVDMLARASVSEFPSSLNSGVIQGLQSKVLQLEHDLTALRVSFGENWPAVVQRRDELAAVREQLDREKLAVLTEAREQATLELAAAQSRRNLLAGSLASQQQLVNQIENATIQYNIIRREVETNQKMYDGMLERLKQASVTAGMEFGGFHVVEPATPFDEVASPNVKWTLALAAVLGLALGVCIALARDYWDTSVSTVEEVEHLTSLPTLGSVPLVPGAGPALTLLSRWRAALPQRLGGAPTALTRAGKTVPFRPLPIQLSSHSAAAEAVRNVCASILLSRSGRPPKVLMVTSAVPGEGKTTMVRELGQALAERGAKTLLVECDLRRPAFHLVFDVDPKGGLSLFLAGLGRRTPAINEVSPDLHVVAAGPPAPNPVALLNSDKLKSFLDEMAGTYQFIILDAPPVIGLADTRVLAPMTEGVVLVVRAGKVQKAMVRRVSMLLEATGAQVLGAVLNGAEVDDAGAGYYGYYGEDYYRHNQAG